MLAEKINGAEEYLARFEKEFKETKITNCFPKINIYYKELTSRFLSLTNKKEENFFIQMGKLLAIDAQLQILLEIAKAHKEDLVDEIGMNEDEIIQMIKKDHKYFYREITGVKFNQPPKLGLIYLSEE
ncbi:DUF7006 family protein [Enterococcus casseliflavus]|uniref:DUF7006 family protein n=1 Tax=Enterococcus casseliflavus TaxID=37734 RepID=UPI001BCAC27C|nr:hypothetical protein [Enterococcus casseliflavus]